MKNGIVLQHVSKCYGSYHQLRGIKNTLFDIRGSVKALRSMPRLVLDDVSLSVRKGETLGIVGNNGAGKSTLLGLIAGVLKPSSGDVIVNGHVSPMLELGGGFHPELTGRENILLNGVLLGMNKRHIIAHMDEIIAFSGLEEYIDQPIKTFSSGMMARLGFSIISSLDPDILLLDEVLAVGDRTFQLRCMEKLHAFRTSGVTIVFVSHAMAEFVSLCDNVAWVERGKLRMMGDAGEVVSQYTETSTLVIP